MCCKFNSILIFRILLLGIIVLLPLLGATWLLGLLFLIDNESVVVAWVFTIVNSLQVSVETNTIQNVSNNVYY